MALIVVGCVLVLVPFGHYKASSWFSKRIRDPKPLESAEWLEGNRRILVRAGAGCGLVIMAVGVIQVIVQLLR